MGTYYQEPYFHLIVLMPYLEVLEHTGMKNLGILGWCLGARPLPQQPSLRIGQIADFSMPYSYIKFSVTLSPPLPETQPLECDCSACRRFGYLLTCMWWPPQPTSFVPYLYVFSTPPIPIHHRT